MKNSKRIILIVVLILVLVGIRAVLTPLFYDPLNDYFKNDYLYKSLPSIELGRYFLNLFLRYFLNTVISLAIIYVAFRNLKLIQFSVKFYLVAFLLLASILFTLLKFQYIDGYLLLFYVRRFLIHPIFVFILLPAFYYQKIQLKN
jgi:exosortase F-associated protein